MRFHILGDVCNVLYELMHSVQLDVPIIQHRRLVERLVHRLAVFTPIRAIGDEAHVELPSHPISGWLAKVPGTRSTRLLDSVARTHKVTIGTWGLSEYVWERLSNNSSAISSELITNIFCPRISRYSRSPSACVRERSAPCDQ